MSYKQIDEQLLLELCNLYQDFLSESEVYDGADFWGNSRVKEIRKQLHEQAKAKGYQEAIEDMNEDKAYKENKL